MAAAGALACGGRRSTHASPSYIFAFAGADDVKGTGSDLLAVIDADPKSASYATVVAAVPLNAVGTMPHHTEMRMPAGGRWLFANAFMAGRTYLFDLTDPLAPRIAATVDSIPGFSHPHSYTRLDDGRVVATLQFGNGRAPGDAGGLAIFSPQGKLLQTVSSADAAFKGAPIRTYSMDIAPGADRIVTTSSPMSDIPSADVIQLWRLSDLSLLKTVAMPKIAGDSTSRLPFEVRFLPGDTSAFLNTWNCGFFYLSGLKGSSPTVEHVLSLPQPRYSACGVPLLFSHFWIMPVGAARVYLVYDIADPHHPKQVSEFTPDSMYDPHWTAREPHTDRIVVTSNSVDHRVLIARFDSVAGVLALDTTFRDPVTKRVGVDFNRRSWPGGEYGPALPHAAIFSAPQ